MSERTDESSEAIPGMASLPDGIKEALGLGLERANGEMNGAHLLGQVLGSLVGALDGAEEAPISTDSNELTRAMMLVHAFLDGFCSRLPEAADAQAPRWELTGQLFVALDGLHDIVGPLETGLREMQVRTLMGAGFVPERIVIERNEDGLSFGSTTSEVLDENLLRASTGEFDDAQTGEQHRMRRLRFVDLFPKDFEPLPDIDGDADGCGCGHDHEAETETKQSDSD